MNGRRYPSPFELQPFLPVSPFLELDVPSHTSSSWTSLTSCHVINHAERQQSCLGRPGSVSAGGVTPVQFQLDAWQVYGDHIASGKRLALDRPSVAASPVSLESHASLARLDYDPLFSHADGGQDIYSPSLHRTSDWWNLGPHDGLHDGSIAFRRHKSGAVAGSQHSRGSFGRRYFCTGWSTPPNA